MISKDSHLQHIISNLIAIAVRENKPIILLESQLESHPASQRSYLGFGVKKSIQGNAEADSWEVIDAFRKEHAGWVFGYLGYDLKNAVEMLVSKNADPVQAPDFFLFEPELVIEFSGDGMNVLQGELPGFESIDTASSFSLHPKAVENRDHFIKSVKVAQDRITEGEFYEINLSHQMEYTFEGDPFQLYQAMKENGPVPFASYLHFDGLHISCASPERFLKKEGQKVISQPIKGTLSHTKDGDSEKEREQLRSSAKDQAENLMIVDLVRNDLSRIAHPNTVKVSKLFDIESFETVHQMVSTVEAEVEGGYSEIDIIKAAFPMGSMTGAPKIRAMESIEELEDYKRGIYSGAIGYFNPNQDFDFNVVIRTAIIRDDALFYAVGGAITADSDPEREWDETMVKARALSEVNQTIFEKDEWKRV